MGLKTVLRHPFYECVSTMVAVLNVLSLFGRVYINTFGTSRAGVTAWIVWNYVINFAFLAEWILISVAFGVKYCIKSKINWKFELILQCASIPLFIRFISGSLDYGQEIRFLELIILIRMLRIFNLLKEISQWRLILDTFR